MAVLDYGLLTNDEKHELCLKGDINGIDNLIVNRGISITNKIKPNTFTAAIVRDEILFVDTKDADIICLINFNLFKADEACRFSGGTYVFNFKDEESCVNFIVGYYYSYLLQLSNLDIHDVYYALGHRESQKGIIKSIAPENWRDSFSTPGLLLINFSHGETFTRNKNIFQEINAELKNNKYKEMALLEYSQETTTISFEGMFVFEEGCRCIRMW